jgi:hypothetical protein
MSQALNLAIFANKLNSSGATDNTGLQNSSLTVNTTSPLAGGGAVALGSSLTLTHANSGVTPAYYTNANITVNAEGHITAASNGPSGITAIATGNGLSGGPITTSGTLTIACPNANSVGSYALVTSLNGGTFTYGVNYAAGTAANQLGTACVYQESGETYSAISPSTELSGTWKWMGRTITSNQYACAIACRVS